MSDLDAEHAELWLAYVEGRIAEQEWQQALRDVVGLRRFVRRAREREMRKEKKEAHRGLRWR